MANPYFLHDTWKIKKQNPDKPMKLSKPLPTEVDQNWSFLLSRNWPNDVNGALWKQKDPLERPSIYDHNKMIWPNRMQRHYVPRSSEITNLPRISEYFYNLQPAHCSNISQAAMFLLMPVQHRLLRTVIPHTKYCCHKGASY